MEFPFGHPHHSHHREEERHHPKSSEVQSHHHGFPPGPRTEPYGEPPPPYPGPYPPPGNLYPEPQLYPPPPPHHQPGFPPVSHFAHQGPPAEVVHADHHSFHRPEFGPSSASFHRPEFGPSSASFPRHEGRPDLPRGQVVRAFCKANPDFSLTIRHGSVVLAPVNAHDEFQHWIKDEKYSTKVKDEASCPSFALVNKATGQALKHGLGETQPVLLTEYRPDAFDESILWTMSQDMGNGFRTLRQVNNIRLNVDAFHGDKKSGGITDGTPVVLWEWKKGENQLWKLVPY